MCNCHASITRSDRITCLCRRRSLQGEAKRKCASLRFHLAFNITAHSAGYSLVDSLGCMRHSFTRGRKNIELLLERDWRINMTGF